MIPGNHFSPIIFSTFRILDHNQSIKRGELPWKYKEFYGRNKQKWEEKGEENRKERQSEVLPAAKDFPPPNLLTAAQKEVVNATRKAVKDPRKRI